MGRSSLADSTRELDALEIRVVVDNESDTLSSIDAGVPQIPELVPLLATTPATRDFEGRECRTVFDRLCCACHGLSVLLTGHQGNAVRTMLFDVGPDPDVWLANARRMRVDLASIECIFLSHWHADHSGGLPAVVAAIATARSAAGQAPPVVDLHPDRPDQRGILLPTGIFAMLAEEPGLADIEQAGGAIVQEDQAHPLCDDFFSSSGTIARRTPYETGLPGHHSFRGDRVEPDPLILDERFVAARVRGRGVSVFSACSHAGIVNACLEAKEAFPGSPIDTVLGGFHLAGTAVEGRIEPTIRDLRDRIEPGLVAPGHCTGWRAKVELARTFAPGRYAPSVVGTGYRLLAATG